MPCSHNGEPPYTPTYLHYMKKAFGCLLGGEENALCPLSCTDRQLSVRLYVFFIPVIAFILLNLLGIIAQQNLRVKRDF